MTFPCHYFNLFIFFTVAVIPNKSTCLSLKEQPDALFPRTQFFWVKLIYPLIFVVIASFIY